MAQQSKDQSIAKSIIEKFTVCQSEVNLEDINLEDI